MRGAGAHLCQEEVKNGWKWGWAPTHREASLASLEKSFVTLEAGERWLEQLVVPKERGLGSRQPRGQGQLASPICTGR